MSPANATYFVGVLAVLLVVLIVVTGAQKKDRYVAIPAPAGGWPAAKADGPLYGGTIPGWND